MGNFVDYNSVDLSKMKPDCPSCNNKNVEFIDIVQDSQMTGGTLPVFICKNCDKIYGKRGESISNSLAANSYAYNAGIINYQNYTVDSLTDIYSNSIKDKSDLQKDEIKSCKTRIDLIELEINVLTNKIDEYQKDPHLALKNKIKKFELI